MSPNTTKTTNAQVIQGYDPEPFGKDMLMQNDIGTKYLCNGHLEGLRLTAEINGGKVILGIGESKAMFDRNSLVPFFNSLLDKIS